MKSMEEFYKNKNVLVTGGAGFIGSHLVEKLVELNANVTILDNLATGQLKNLSSILPYINIIYGDITNHFTTIKASKNQNIIFHLAALTSVAESIQNPSLCKKINIEGTKNILEGCKKNNVVTCIFSSSSAVYGNKNEQCKESDSTNPLSPYAQSKLESEKLCQNYSKEYGINIACLRYFNVYGKNQNPNGEYAAVVAKFKHNLINKKPLMIFGDGKQTRDFIHVSKIVQANLKIAMNKNLNSEIFNIASGKSINLFELIKNLEKETKTKNVNIIFKAARIGDIFYSAANCEKYKKLIK
ncbi:NAD-dependent epimerase/dehydratase family protein [Candidatus Dependentiae bacterium]|nr:NAD-dependent epimerase/dehydratase family protein [Candidatus Dependentiae bacterium]